MSPWRLHRVDAVAGLREPGVVGFAPCLGRCRVLPIQPKSYSMREFYAGLPGACLPVFDGRECVCCDP